MGTSKQMGLRWAFLLAALGCAASSPNDFRNGYVECIRCDQTLERLSYGCDQNVLPSTALIPADFAQICHLRKFFSIERRPNCLEIIHRLEQRAAQLKQPG